MSPREPAERQLERILYILPLAARDGGASLSALAADLDVTPERILRDLAEITAADVPAGDPIPIDVSIEGDRVGVWTTGEFGRPVRLSPRESLALALGLRLLEDEAGPERKARLRDLAGRLDEALSAMPAGAATAALEIEAGAAASGPLLALLRDATRARRPCRIRYLKPGATLPEERRLHPYVLVFASGHWYAIGADPAAAGIRAFRLDRMLDVAIEDGGFEVPDDFRAGDWIEEGGLFFAETEMVARVRYSPRVARWLRERAGPGEAERQDEPDGSLVVWHRVADPGWLVRHVLVYGAEAELLEPEGMRELIAGRVAPMCAPGA